MHVQHHLHSLFLVKVEECTQHLDHKVHRRKVVIKQQHLKQRRAGYFGPGGLERQPAIVIVFLILGHGSDDVYLLHLIIRCDLYIPAARPLPDVMAQ